MADRAKKISELTALTAASGDDLLVIVDDPSSANVATKKITVNNFFNAANAVVVSANTFILRNNQTPANSSITVTKGTIMYDSNYLYIATANNTLKRVALSSF